MPFDQVNFALPAVETDLALRALIDGRTMIVTNWSGPGRSNSGPDRYCAYAAIATVAQRLTGNGAPNSMHDPKRCPVNRAASAALAAALPWDSTWRIKALESPDTALAYVWCFNDDPKTTHADVLALFDRAISARRAAIASKDEQAA